MDLTPQQIADHLGNMSVMDLCSLTKDLEERWGVKALPQAPVLVEHAQPTVTHEEQTEFTVTLVAIKTENRIGAIKVVRGLTGLGLKEAKDLVDALPKALKEGISKVEADDLRAQLVAVGATATIT